MWNGTDGWHWGNGKMSMIAMLRQLTLGGQSPVTMTPCQISVGAVPEFSGRRGRIVQDEDHRRDADSDDMRRVHCSSAMTESYSTRYILSFELFGKER
jgi:hypothetical protein